MRKLNKLLDRIWQTRGTLVLYKLWLFNKENCNLYEHIESRHCPISGYTRVVCTKSCTTNYVMRNHNVYYHQTSKIIVHGVFVSSRCGSRMGYGHALIVTIHQGTILMYMSILRASMYLILATFACFTIRFVQSEKHWDVISRNHKNTNMFLLKVVEYALYVTKHQRKNQRFMNILSQSMWKVRVTYVQNVVQSVSLGRHWYAILEGIIQNPKLDQTAVTVTYVEKLLTTLKG